MDDKDWYYLFLRQVDAIYNIDKDDLRVVFIDEVPETPTRTETEFDNVNHPKHYTEGRKYEPIDIIEDWGLGMHAGNAVKYISRAGRKGDVIEDLEKARWYVDRYVQKNDKFFIKLWQKTRRLFMDDLNPEPCIVAKDWNLDENLKEALYHIAMGNIWTMKKASELLTKEINARKEVMNGRI